MFTNFFRQTINFPFHHTEPFSPKPSHGTLPSYLSRLHPTTQVPKSIPTPRPLPAPDLSDLSSNPYIYTDRDPNPVFSKFFSSSLPSIFQRQFFTERKKKSRGLRENGIRIFGSGWFESVDEWIVERGENYGTGF